jgi:uncharacterized protein YndB with AHSA1/START domain
MVQEEGTGKKLKLRVSRVIRAKREAVFNAWTKPEFIQQWFGPENTTAPNVSLDFRVGGSYRIQVQSCEASEDTGMRRISQATGVYKEIVPNELLSFTWHGDWDPSLETLVTVVFKEVAGGTEVILTHERFVTVESRDKHEHGWTGTLDKLARFSEAR